MAGFRFLRSGAPRTTTGAPETVPGTRIPVPYPLWCAYTDTTGPRVGLVVAWQHNGTTWEPLVAVEDTNQALDTVHVPPAGRKFLASTRRADARTLQRRAGIEEHVPREIVAHIARIVARREKITTTALLTEIDLMTLTDQARTVWDGWDQTQRVAALHRMEEHGLLLSTDRKTVSDYAEWLWVGGTS